MATKISAAPFSLALMLGPIFEIFVNNDDALGCLCLRGFGKDIDIFVPTR
jgi:hypothetical protein